MPFDLEKIMKKIIVSFLIYFFSGMTLFAQVSFGDILFRDDNGVSLITYGFTNRYDEINTFTIQEINGTMPRTLEWTLINNEIANELRNEMIRRNVDFAFRMVDHDGRYLLYVWRRFEDDFFFSSVIW